MQTPKKASFYSSIQTILQHELVLIKVPARPETLTCFLKAAGGLANRNIAVSKESTPDVALTLLPAGLKLPASVDRLYCFRPPATTKGPGL